MGPNGSGKSNISDAIRWVLGEQSVKSLRGSKMNDVIFQGGENSNPLNMAEVNLNFDNTDKSLNIEYDKVTITRRIYRDGENEYKVNGKKVRLRDIKELFLDTGIGKEGYSLIGQGRIDEIISSSNLERRAIFEEASGIAKHKYRRDEANKKLAKVTDDLEIIEYEWDYKKKDLEKLRVEADNFKTWQALTKSLDEKVYNYFRLKSELLLTSKENLTTEIKDYDLEIENISGQIKSIEKSLAPFNLEHSKLKEDLSQKSSKLSDLTKANEVSKNKIDLNKQKISFSQRDLDRISENLADNDKKSQDTRNKLLASKEKIADLDKTSKDLSLEITKLANEKAELISENEQLLAKDASIKKELDQTQKKIYDYELNQKTKEILDKKRAEDQQKNLEKLDQVNEESNLINDKLKDLTSNKLKLYEKNEDLSGEIKATEEKIEQINAELNRLNTNLSQNNIELKSKINEYKFNQNLIESNEGYFYAVSDFLNKTKANNLDGLYEDTLANLISVKDGYVDIIDNLIGAGLQNIVSRTKDETRDLIKFINSNRIGRITFLPMDSVKGFRKEAPAEREVIAMAYELVDFDISLTGIIDHFLGSTVVVKNIDDAISLSKKIKGYRIISLDLDVINSWGSMAAGSNSNKKSNAGILNRSKKIDRLKTDISRLRKEKDRIEEKTKDYLRNKNILIDGLDKLKTSYNQTAENLTEINNQIASYDIRLEHLASLKDELSVDIEIRDELANEIDIASLYKSQEKLKNLSRDYGLKLAANSGKLETIKNLILTKENELEIVSRDINLLYNTIGELEDELKNLEYSLSLEAKLNEENLETVEATTRENEKLRKLIEANTEKISKLEDELLLLNENINQKEDENKNQLSTLEGMKEKLNKLELEKVKISYKLESTIKDYDSLVDDLNPFISVTLDELSLSYGNTEIQKVTKTDLINLQKQINAIGYFNADSIENYKQADEEFKFLDIQVRDLKASKANIESMIENLEAEMKDEFKKNFDIINEKFQRIFTILFMGGEARLTLDSSDELTAGVDIIARPPSKSLKTISLLSGGEKALTAVALLFAIFETNPAPFAILDEIDAALDETNIKRYIEYLKTLSENSQFIMITHRQTTMQLAEMIYGITIGDDGVSKIYSIDFDSN